MAHGSGDIYIHVCDWGIYIYIYMYKGSPQRIRAHSRCSEACPHSLAQLVVHREPQGSKDLPEASSGNKFYIFNLPLNNQAAITRIYVYIYISGNCRAVTCTHVKLTWQLHGIRAIPCIRGFCCTFSVQIRPSVNLSSSTQIHARAGPCKSVQWGLYSCHGQRRVKWRSVSSASLGSI